MAPRPRKGKIAEPTGFSSLSKTEQIRYLLTLWDRISKRPGEIPVPESHLDLAKERLAAYRRDPHRARPAPDALHRLANPHRWPSIGWVPSRAPVSTPRRRTTGMRARGAGWVWGSSANGARRTT